MPKIISAVFPLRLLWIHQAAGLRQPTFADMGPCRYRHTFRIGFPDWFARLTRPSADEMNRPTTDAGL